MSDALGGISDPLEDRGEIQDVCQSAAVLHETGQRD
jgi:hypothetical protein